MLITIIYNMVVLDSSLKNVNMFLIWSVHCVICSNFYIVYKNVLIFNANFCNLNLLHYISLFSIRSEPFMFLHSVRRWIYFSWKLLYFYQLYVKQWNIYLITCICLLCIWYNFLLSLSITFNLLELNVDIKQ